MVDVKPRGTGGSVGGGTKLVTAVPSRVRGPVVEVGEMFQLLGRVVYSAIRHPRGYWSDTRDEMYYLLRYGVVPAFATVGIFTFVISSVGYGLLHLLGSAQRMAQFTLTVAVRESAPFMTGMVVAGVMGTAVTADLGARKIREELDAMRVLGLDAMRLLVLPRAISLTLMTMLLTIVSVVASVLCGILVGCIINDITLSVYMDNLLRDMSVPELWGMALKTALIGLLIAVVHSYKGLNVGGGPEGVGRAVNQAVVIAFVGMFILNLGFNATIQGLYPELQTMR
ncbi:ABC transporter permease [Amycolatopsis sp. K13G38]|uniref:ABC transporter permease n=1 Tax=Amycolatopsis acididurans TaxID=2724524 RepID=A0ABX1J3J9_9PSEU|nr:ABC transporter permease [Amycolatopsis acididurans]NKQ54239.1 ABC transporter permease [Amycolatopsis acididurans]